MSRSTIIEHASFEELLDAIARQYEYMHREQSEKLERLALDILQNRQVITLREACAYFDHRVAEATLRKAIDEEGLPAHKRGRIWFVDREELMQWQMGRSMKFTPPDRESIERAYFPLDLSGRVLRYALKCK